MSPTQSGRNRIFIVGLLENPCFNLLTLLPLSRTLHARNHLTHAQYFQSLGGHVGKVSNQL